MIPSFNTQLQVVIRALREVVAPVLPQGEKQAVEQLHLSLAMLTFIREKLPYARRYHRLELERYLELGEKALALVEPRCATLGQALKDGRAELARPQAEIEDYLYVTRRLRERLAALVTEAAGKPHEQKLDALILEASKALILQERAWFVPYGFELRPETLPTMDQLLKE